MIKGNTITDKRGLEWTFTNHGYVVPTLDCTNQKSKCSYRIRIDPDMTGAQWVWDIIASDGSKTLCGKAYDTLQECMDCLIRRALILFGEDAAKPVGRLIDRMKPDEQEAENEAPETVKPKVAARSPYDHIKGPKSPTDNAIKQMINEVAKDSAEKMIAVLKRRLTELPISTIVEGTERGRSPLEEDLEAAEPHSQAEMIGSLEKYELLGYMAGIAECFTQAWAQRKCSRQVELYKAAAGHIKSAWSGVGMQYTETVEHFLNCCGLSTIDGLDDSVAIDESLPNFRCSGGVGAEGARRLKEEQRSLQIEIEKADLIDSLQSIATKFARLAKMSPGKDCDIATDDLRDEIRRTWNNLRLDYCTDLWDDETGESKTTTPNLDGEGRLL